MELFYQTSFMIMSIIHDSKIQYNFSLMPTVFVYKPRYFRLLHNYKGQLGRVLLLLYIRLLWRNCEAIPESVLRTKVIPLYYYAGCVAKVNKWGRVTIT